MEHASCPLASWQLASCPLLDRHYTSKHAKARANASSSSGPHLCSRRSSSNPPARRLLSLLAGRTLLLLGDSVSEQHFHGTRVDPRPWLSLLSIVSLTLRIFHPVLAALACSLLTEHQPSWWPSHATAAELWKTRSCLPFDGDVLLCYVSAGKAQERQALRPWILSARLRLALRPSDVVLINVGLHYANASAAATCFTQLVGPLLGRDANLSSSPPLLIWRETSPQHFVGGRYPSLAPERGCVPLATGADCRDCNLYNEAINPLAQRDGLPILRVWSSASAYWNEHLAPPRDCTHWILPGVQEQWSQRLSSLLASQSSRLAPAKQSLSKRWTALRKAFVGLPGCVSRPAAQPQAAAPSAMHGTPPLPSARGLAEANVSTACCSSRCRDAHFLPHSPPSGAHH